MSTSLCLAAYEVSTEWSWAGDGTAWRRSHGVRASASCSDERSAKNTPGDSIGSTKPKASPTIAHPRP